MNLCDEGKNRQVTVPHSCDSPILILILPITMARKPVIETAISNMYAQKLLNSDVSELLGKRFALSQPTLHSLVVYWKEEANLSKESRAMISLWNFQLDASFRIYVFLFTLFAINILNCWCLTFSNSINPVFPNVNWTLKCQSNFQVWYLSRSPEKRRSKNRSYK